MKTTRNLIGNPHLKNRIAESRQKYLNHLCGYQNINIQANVSTNT